MKNSLWFDCDPGSDDFAALLMVLAHPDRINLLGISTVSGNVPVELTARNALRACETARRPEIPVHAGAARPLVGEAVSDGAYGGEGLGGVRLPPPSGEVDGVPGVDAMIDAILSREEMVTVAATAPLTNLALAFRREPAIIERIEIVAMGGGFLEEGFAGTGRKGNITERAEFNIFADPEAAEEVFRQARRITVAPFELALAVHAEPERAARIASVGTQAAEIVAEMLSPEGVTAVLDRDNFGVPGPAVPDPLVAAYLLDPDLFQLSEGRIRIEVTDGPSRGETHFEPLDGGPARLMTGCDKEGFYRLLENCLARHASQPG